MRTAGRSGFSAAGFLRPGRGSGQGIQKAFTTTGWLSPPVCPIRRAFPDAKKVKASRSKGEASFLTEEEPDTERLAKAIEETGYTFISAEAEPYKRRGLFG